MIIDKMHFYNKIIEMLHLSVGAFFPQPDR